MSSNKAYIIETPEGYVVGYLRDNYGELVKIYGVAWIYILKDSKIYYVEFKHLVNPSKLGQGCRGIYTDNRIMVYECSKGVEKFVESIAKNVREIAEYEYYVYSALKKALPHLFPTQ